MMKVCSKCKIEKPVTEFSPRHDVKKQPAYKSYCKACGRVAYKEYASDERVKEQTKQRSREWYIKNQKRRREKAKRWVEQNSDRYKYLSKRWKENNKEKRREEWQRRRSTPKGRVDHSFGAQMRNALREKKGGRRWEQIVGYTIDDLMAHLEAQFVDGMNWDNFGEWHIDHIIPKAHFMFESTEDESFQECWALSNLQPLWAYDNLSKGAKIGA